MRLSHRNNHKATNIRYPPLNLLLYKGGTTNRVTKEATKILLTTYNLYTKITEVTVSFIKHQGRAYPPLNNTF